MLPGALGGVSISPHLDSKREGLQRRFARAAHENTKLHAYVVPAKTVLGVAVGARAVFCKGKRAKRIASARSAELSTVTHQVAWRASSARPP